MAEICFKFEGKNFISLPGNSCCFLDLASMFTIVPEEPGRSIIKWPPGSGSLQVKDSKKIERMKFNINFKFLLIPYLKVKSNDLLHYLFTRHKNVQVGSRWIRNELASEI